MARLIINADDLGFCGEVNEAVKKCFSLKKISGASLMPSGQAFLEAVAMLKSLGIKEIGVHLALTGGLTPGCPDKGYLGFAVKYLTGTVDRRHIHSELKSQIEKVKAQGLSITHIDSHEHIHMLPGILKTVIALAKEYAIPFIRFPYEPSFVMFKSFRVKDLFRHVTLKVLCLLGMVAVKRSGLGHNARFLGHFHSGRIDTEVFDHFLGGVKDGVYEIAFHPAVVTDEFIKKYPQYVNSGIELSALEGLGLRGLKEKGVTVITHRDTPVTSF